ncbi:hypothetical protein VTG60DRAFT_3141 [Thermothelomyces hinnuleus]
MREELKGRNLSFTEIAKLVGENWQNLTAAEKEPFEARAQAIKDKYLADLAEYKKTPQYSQYQAYLREFKAKHGSPSQDKDASKRVRLSEHGGQGRGSPGAITTRTSRSGSGADSRRGSPPTSARQRIPSVMSSDSQYTSSLAPSTSITSPEDSVFSSTESNPDQQHAMNRSPPIKLEPKEQSPLLSSRHASQRDDQGREQSSMHRHLPSLSDVFDGQGLPGTMRPPSDPSGYRFPGAHIMGSPGRPLGHRGGDARSPPMTNGTEHRYSDDSSSSHLPFGLPQPSVDGPLPIHALLDSRPEPTFRSHQPAPLQPSNTHLATEQNHNPSPVHQSPSSGSGRQIINGYHDHHHSASPLSHYPSSTTNEHQINQASALRQQQQQLQQQQQHHQQQQQQQQQKQQQQQQQQSPPHLAGISQQGNPTSNLDGMSALLRAGELVDRRTQ